MTGSVTLTVAAVEALASTALARAGARAEAAASLARGIAAAERDGLASHGLAYLPTYCEHLGCGKVDGTAIPLQSRPAPGLILIDAGTGFAHPAIDVGLADLAPLAGRQGIAALAISNSYNCGVLAYHTERIAEAGLVGLGFTNAPASIAPVGAPKPVVGTNPWSLAVPDGVGGVAFVIDQSASVVAKSEVMKRARRGEPIPEGWALGPDGAPTTDPAIGLKGTMVPAGGYKGVGAALLVEVMAAALAGATLGIHASPFSGTVGGPPRTGQFFIAIDPVASSGGVFAGRIAALVEALRAEPGAHLPGDRRRAARERADRDGVGIDKALFDRVRQLAGE
jgi:(2R)-3-sulfolactate dehydrogenase (NADP+)